MKMDFILFSGTSEAGEARACVPVSKETISWLFWNRASGCLWWYKDTAWGSRGSWARGDVCRRRSSTWKNRRSSGWRTRVQRVRHGVSETLHPDHAHAETREVAQLQVHCTYMLCYDCSLCAWLSLCTIVSHFSCVVCLLGLIRILVVEGNWLWHKYQFTSVLFVSSF